MSCLTGPWLKFAIFVNEKRDLISFAKEVSFSTMWCLHTGDTFFKAIDFNNINTIQTKTVISFY